METVRLTDLATPSPSASSSGIIASEKSLDGEDKRHNNEERILYLGCCLFVLG